MIDDEQPNKTMFRIDLIDLNIKENVKTLLILQKKSYLEEAKIINYEYLPPLFETIENYQNTKEKVYGLYIKNELCSFISIETYRNELEICKLAVAPKYFRKGFAQHLLNFILKQNTTLKIKVSTGKGNYPAIALYMKNGFIIKDEKIINNQLTIVNFERVQK